MRVSKILTKPQALKASIINTKKVADYEGDDDAGYGVDNVYHIYFMNKNAKVWETSYDGSVDSDGYPPHLHFYIIYNSHQLITKLLDIAHYKNEYEPSTEFDKFDTEAIISDIHNLTTNASKNDLFIFDRGNLEVKRVNKLLRKKAEND